MTLPLPSLPTSDAGEFVASDLPCRKCAYNLRGLRSDGRCPECGAAVGLSLQGDLLRFSDPAWLQTLRRGTRVIILGIIAVVLAVIISIPVGMMVPNAAPPLVVMSIGMLFAWGCFLIGSWWLTTPDPSGIGEDQYGTARKIIRISLAVGVANAGISAIPDLITLPPDGMIFLRLLTFCASIVSIIGTCAQLHYLEKLATRIPDSGLSWRAHFLKFALPISYGGMVIMALAAAFAARVGSGGLMTAGCFSGLFSLGVLVFGIMYLGLLERLGKRFKEQVRIANDSWSKLNPAMPDGNESVSQM